MKPPYANTQQNQQQRQQQQQQHQLQLQQQEQPPNPDLDNGVQQALFCLDLESVNLDIHHLGSAPARVARFLRRQLVPARQFLADKRGREDILRPTCVRFTDHQQQQPESPICMNRENQLFFANEKIKQNKESQSPNHPDTNQHPVAAEVVGLARIGGDAGAAESSWRKN
ncbi:uncharacterized protein LOC134207361 [Armigeres subalbatus]|uniref:uncharacterized protein LOC134207361 n=1 Tax=Armigeres subalbatus TaxID=124917 RepID=UPI002ED15A0A